MLDDYKKQYQHSEEERKDLIETYIKLKGNMDKIMEEIPCSTFEDEERFREIYTKAIKEKEIKSYKAFTSGK
jgi:DnaJ family protein C protein 9